MKKLLCAVVSVLMLASLYACGETPADESPAQPESSEEESIAPAAPETITINGKDISEFTIIYRDTNVAAKYLYAAQELRDYIEQHFGKRLEIACETEKLPETENEIYVGLINNRDFCDEYFYRQYKNGEYINVISGGKLMFASGTANGAHFGIQAFIESIAESKGEFIDGHASGEKKVKRVSCVGDSITQGVNSTDKENYTYPAFLQQMLGLDYCVTNLGLSGYSTCRTDTYSYMNHAIYARSLDSEPDIIIYALGTNDCNPGQAEKNWVGTDREEVFVSSTKEMLDAYLALDTHPQIFICLPCSLFKVGADGWQAEKWTANNEKYSVPLLTEIAREYDLPVIDLWTWSKAHPEVFVDGLHPKDETYKDFALAIYEGIKDYLAE